MLTPSQREEISWPETVRDFGFIPDSWYGNDYEAWGPKFSSSVMSWILKKDYLYYAADMAERLAMHIPSHLRNPDRGQGRLFGGGFAVHERVLLEDAGIHGS
ncbi:hypothetical protein NIB75_18420 [Bacteroides uniformis]|nr:hypothetical protein [Bacteroides uniformis]